jgi:hypothetical protein
VAQGEGPEFKPWYYKKKEYPSIVTMNETNIFLLVKIIE